ncbi:hypothetical protein HUT06_15290 [Actinomadura sp. NAK00032]|uniref:hypothetical protein n=1 Tax=Actinomadura sp. NAK00032 TaxID=2742128 RepID=UPI00159138FE|nr:hypothetical protein [Actinomadura sp. NAK00032]QKW35235.1 hypothetical protein HUT06_15290 [Actinomadura sp. NAK00032]
MRAAHWPGATALVWPHRFSPAYLDAALREWPTLRPTLAAVLTTCTIGAVINDYGIRLITYGLITVLPLLALTCARTPNKPNEHNNQTKDDPTKAGPEQSLRHN